MTKAAVSVALCFLLLTSNAAVAKASPESQAEFPPTLESLTSAAIAGGTIKFAADGIIEINNPVEFATNVVLDANGHRVVLTGNGASALIRILESAQLTLKGLHLTHGKAAPVSEANTARARGGAIQNLGGALTITDCTFSNNVAVVTQPDSSTVADASGGAIWQSEGSLQIQGSTFMNNQAEGIPFSVQFVGLYPQARGGAITIDGGTLEIEGSHFAGNSVAGVPGAGGAIFFQGTEFKVQESRFETNSASIEPRGGAIYVQSGHLESTNSVFVMNGAFSAGGNIKMGLSGSASGGAIYNAADALIGATSFLTNRTTSGPGDPPFYEIRGSFGGAIFNNGTMVVVNSTFAGDEAASLFRNTFSGQLDTTHGMASAVFSTDGSITNSTFVAGRWGKSLVEGSNPANLRVKNSIFANIPAQTVLPEDMIPLGRFSLVNFTDAGHNLSSDAPQFTEATSKTNVNLRLGPLGYHGDRKPVYPLLEGSPAIDAADDSAAPATDQRGRARPFGAHSDIGAFESSAPFHVWGKVKGYQDPSTIFTIGTNSFAISANGGFSLGMLPAGTSQINISAENAVFLPNPWIVDINADGAVSGFTSFELHALTYDGSITEPKFVLTGLEGEEWKVEMTQDFQTWSDIGTFTIDSSGSTTVPVPAGDTLFLRVTGQ